MCVCVCVCVRVCVCVCVSPSVLAPKGINNQWHDIGCVQLVKQVSWFSCFKLLYKILAVQKVDGRGHINTAHRECLPKKTKVTRY